MSFEAYRWLLLWLLPANEYIPIKIGRYYYIIEKYFRMSFNTYTVFRNTTTNEYIWYVLHNNKFDKKEFLSSKRYYVYTDLLLDVSQQFYQKWKPFYQSLKYPSNIIL
jgi:hypothetical protein